MAEEPGVAVVLYNNPSAIAEKIDAAEFSGAAEALQKYGTLVRDVLLDLCGYKEFSHVEFLELPTSYNAGDASSPLAIAVGTPLKDEGAALLGLSSVKAVLDVYGALTATQPLPNMFNDRIGLDEEGVLGFSDPELARIGSKFNKRLNLETRFPSTMNEEDEDVLAEALGQQLPEDSEISPVHPEDVLNILAVFLHEAAGSPPRAQGPNLFERGGRLVGHALHVPQKVLSMLGRRTLVVRQNLWRVEDFAVGASKAAVKIARKAVRPVLIGYILHRALSTIDDAKDLGIRLAKLPRKEALDLYYTELLGPNYDKQIEQDLLDAVKEVDEGLITEDYKDEKRLLTAAMLRRLEVEEWDKERMKHFYLGSYGLGPWYFDMEERLHNPYFIGARAWNGPVEGWVGKNKVFLKDLPNNGSSGAAALNAIEKALGKTLTPSQRKRILAAEQPAASDLLTTPGGLLHGVFDKKRIQEHVAATAQ